MPLISITNNFYFLIQDSFLTQHVLESSRKKNVLYIYSFVITKRISGQCKQYMNHWVIVTTMNTF